MRRGRRTFPLSERHEVGAVRRGAADLARSLGFQEAEACALAIAATELATNVLRHGGGGEIELCPLRHGDREGVELLAVDRGPGIAALDRAREDGYSTDGGLGGGIGAVERLMDTVEFGAGPGRGTRVLARKWRAR